MIFPADADFPQVPVCVPECLTGQTAAVLTDDRADELTLALLAEHMGVRLLLRECWSRCFPQCGVLISSAISGGTLEERFRDAAAMYPRRCWLLLEPIRAEFPLPCPTGTGLPLADIPAGRSFFSSALCCQYTHFLRSSQGVIAMWDTEQTLLQKLELAKSAGFLGFAYVDQNATY